MNNLIKNKSAALSVVLIILVLCILTLSVINKKSPEKIIQQVKTSIQKNINLLSIMAMRNRNYPGSDIKIEQALPDGTNYHQYIASYVSDGLKIYGLLTVPTTAKPKEGYPAIIFNHGYIPPLEYKTTERYIAYVDYFARNGYIVFKSDYRGNGNSEGSPQGAYYSPAYTVDILNALSSIKKYKDVNPSKIGMWGHSMGGNIALRSIVVDTKDIKAAVIWGGVVGTYTDIFNWHDPKYRPSDYELSLRNRYKSELVRKYGNVDSNPSFWNSIDPTSFAKDINTPVQLHAGAADEEVPPEFSEHLYDKLKQAGKIAEIYEYPGADHNISQAFNLAMQRSLAFFDKYLK